MARKPIHSRSRTGRHRVDLSQLPAGPRYAIALLVLVFVLILAVALGGDSGITNETVEPYVPYIGGAVILLVAVSLYLRARGRR